MPVYYRVPTENTFSMDGTCGEDTPSATLGVDETFLSSVPVRAETELHEVCCCSVVLQCGVAVCCCSVLMQCGVAVKCCSAVLCCNVLLQYVTAMCYCSVLLQCVVAVCCCSLLLQYVVAVRCFSALLFLRRRARVLHCGVMCCSASRTP